MGYAPISDYGIIGNMMSAALVSKQGSIDWCCLPRFSSASVFARILGHENGGFFQIKPRGPFESRRHYLSDTNVLRTTFTTDSGKVTLTDFMPCYRSALEDPSSALQIHRLVRCEEGTVQMEVAFQPRMDYARGSTVLEALKHGIAASQGEVKVALSAPHSFQVRDATARSRFTVKRGEEVAYVLRYGTDSPVAPSSHQTPQRLEKTKTFWRELARDCTCDGPQRDEVVRSYLALHLLVYWPTGSIVAAATTSLPEEIGGERNWDYRFNWLRDSSLTLDAFSRLGHKEEAVRYMKWLLDVCAESGPAGQMLYGIEPSDTLDEETLAHLEGYRGSRPVRIGNAAYTQRQLDVFGHVLEAARNYAHIGGYISADTWAVLKDYVNGAVRLWQEPDSGIWEMRGKPAHFVHSKLMCWVAIDRGIHLAKSLDYNATYLKDWEKTAAQIRDNILTRGWNEETGSFTQHYETTAVDASLLLMPLFGLLPFTDRRMQATFERVVGELTTSGLLRRYRTDLADDGVKGSEGMLLWCTFWQIRYLIRLGRTDEAGVLYERLLGYRNDLGLFSEMVDPMTGDALGNMPQALNHLEAIIAGLELHESRRDVKGGT